MRKMQCRRPVLEALEPKQLLSGFGMAEKAEAAEVVLHGMAHGNFSMSILPGTTDYRGSGMVSPIGRVTLRGYLSTMTLPPTGMEYLVSRRQGTLVLQETLISETNMGSALSIELSYNIFGGTGHFAGAVGSGTATEVSIPSPRNPERGFFSGSFIPTTTS